LRESNIHLDPWQKGHADWQKHHVASQKEDKVLVGKLAWLPLENAPTRPASS